jgi:Mitochondrial domain of unknown function (DUF1713)
VHVASFFSIHRPISVTTSVPPASSAETFNAIFSSKKQSKTQPEEVIYTLTSVVSSLESSLHHHQRGSGLEQEELRRTVTQAPTSSTETEATYLDRLSAQDLRASVEEFIKRLRPFNPPLPPTPFDDRPVFEGLQSEQRDIEPTSFHTYSTLLTIRESTHADGHKTYEAHATPFIRGANTEAPEIFNGDPLVEGAQNSICRTYVERLHRHRKIHTISVKRQRKLKMKKHKYKKLLRRTRTLRRKLEKS